MAISLSSTFVSCSDNDDDEPNFAKEIAGAYKGYSVGACNMFSDYLLGDESTATITANEDGTINLVYKSGSGDFTLNNLKLSSNKSFSGSGEVAMSMGGSTGGSYDYTLEGSVDGSNGLIIGSAPESNILVGVNNYYIKYDGVGNGPSTYLNTYNVGGSSAHNNLQPYITVYMWKRVS